MARKKRDFSRKIIPDTRFSNILVAKTINILMRQGKKGVAETSLYGAFDEVEKKAGAPSLDVFMKAVDNIRPLVEVRSRRVGGATYQVPTEVPAERSRALAIRWLSLAASERGEKTLSERLANEIMDAANNRGIAVKKREDTHRMAEANKAFAHFRW